MSVISLLVEFLTILCLPLLAGQVLATRSDKDSLQKLARNYYQLSGLKVSADGSWLTVFKSYDCNRDTVLIINSKVLSQTVAFKLKAREIDFLSNNNLLIQTSLNTELFDPERQTSKVYRNVSQSKVLENKCMFVLQYNAEEQKKLELHDSNGRLLNTAKNVESFYAFGADSVFAVIEDAVSRYNIVLLTSNSTATIYSSSQKISVLEYYPGVKGIIIYAKSLDGITQEVLFLDLIEKMVYPLKDLLPVKFLNGNLGLTDKEGVFFLKIVVKNEKEDNSLLDIWYGNDNKLEQKFLPALDNLYFIWEPVKRRIVQLEKDKSAIVGNIGSSNHFICFDPWLLNTYTKPTTLNVYIFDFNENHYSFFDTVTGDVFISKYGDYIINEDNNKWNVYNIKSDSRDVILNGSLRSPYFIDNEKGVVFEGANGLWLYNPETKRLTKLNSFNTHSITIVNSASKIKLVGAEFFENSVNLKEPLILKLSDTVNRLITYLSWIDGKFDTIIPPTTRYVQNLVHDADFKNFVYIEENYNLPPRIVFKTIGKKSKILFPNNAADTSVLSLRQEIISFTTGDGIPLKGILYYPLSYSSLRKYPMVVHIYEKQIQSANKYLYPTYFEGSGFNIRLLIERGYFVYLPDILIHGRNGPGINALDCINNSLDALAGNKSIDMTKIGLIGHSFGGYETNFIATHSTRFAAFVSGSGTSDLLHSYFAFNYNFFTPDYRRIESGQYRMHIPFYADKSLYFNNNPIYCAENIISPILLWTGKEDLNVPSDNSMEFYNALRRSRKNVIVLFYKGEGHSLQNPLSQMDLTNRIIEWFDYFLKGVKDYEWIDAMKKKEGVL